MWRDEVQAWLIARDSTSLPELFRTLRYDGHPGLWYLCLWLITKVTHAISAMQAFHLAIATATVYLFARCAPFTRIQKALFAFGYFPAFEYSVLCRNYAPGILLLFIFCRLAQERNGKFLWISLVLFLMANTNVYMAILSIVIAAVLGADFLLRRRTPGAVKTPAGWKMTLGFAVIATGIFLSILQLTPPDDAGFARVWKWTPDLRGLEQTLNTVMRAAIPIPQINREFWVSPLLLEKYPMFLKFEAVFSLAVVACVSLAFLRKPSVLAIYLGGTFGLWFFYYAKYLGFLRHHGILFILFVAAAWMFWTDPPPLRPRSRLAGWSEGMGRLLRSAVTILLALHVAGAAVALSMDWKHAFSHGKTVAEYIKRENGHDRLLAGHRDTNVVSVLGYLDRTAMYYPQSDRFGTFVVWNLQHNKTLGDSTVVKRVKDLAVRSGRDVLFIVHYPLSLTDPCVRPVTEFRGSLVQDEDFFLYNVRRPF
jgi:hypothetical protein